MVCRNCGTVIADKALICFRCGTATTEAKFKPAQKARRRSKTSIVLTALAILLLVLIALFFVYFPK